MAYYVEPDYWLDGYAEGDAKLTGAQVVAQSALLAATSRSEVEIGIKADAQSAMLFGANRVTLCGLSADGQSTVNVGMAITVSQAMLAEALSAGLAGTAATRKTGFGADANGIMQSAFRLKWENEEEPSDGWTDSSEPSDLWTDVTEPTDGWS